MAGRRYRSRTGISEERYLAVLEEQGGHCALCPATPKTRRFHADHDHATGELRGLLCFRCNRFLHEWMSPEWLRRAAAYKEGHALEES